MAQMRVPQFIDGFDKSYAMLCHTIPDTAIIFVHGFGGKATSTWRGFHGLVDEYSPDYKWWTTSDMFFYAYESLHTPIRRNADLLVDFVERVWDGRWQEPSAGEKYQDLILAGHSEGAVVIRRMILDRYDTHKANVDNSKPPNRDAHDAAMKTALDSDFLMGAYLRLFAPACMGTNFSSWAGFISSFSLLISAITATSLVRNELLPDSGVLKNLQSGTEKAHATFIGVRSLFTNPLFGVPDQIVVSDSYAGEKLLWERRRDHFSICKPDYAHRRPLEFVSK
jgi:pimeloyl-ACP methyl ester carboxylesterase